MKILIILYPLFIVFWIILCFQVWTKRFNTYTAISGILVITTFCFLYLSKPKYFGEWDLIQTYSDKLKIYIDPIGTAITIHSRITVADPKLKMHLAELLKKNYYNFVSHPSRIWQLKLTLCKGSAVEEFNVYKTKANGTIIERGRQTFQNNDLGAFFEKILFINYEN